MKWFLIQALPLVMGLGIVVAHFWGILVSMCRRCSCSFKDSSAWQHTSKLINTGLMLFYLLYLYLLRMQLDVVNCFPTDPPEDDATYTDFTSESCGGLCRCWEEGGLQMQLVPWTVIAFIIYSIGFPFFLYTVLKKNQVIIIKDQLLRCLGYGKILQ